MKEDSLKLSDQFDDIGDFEDMVRDAEGNASSEFEVNFVSGIQDRYAAYGKNMFFSGKQYDLLERIANGR